MKLIDIKSLKEIEQTPLHDGAYRRGYHHGYLAALEDMESGKSLKQIITFMDEKIAEWRAGDLTQIELPPELK